MSFSLHLDKLFPGALTELQFVNQSADVLKPYGFTRDSAIACVSVCRDEISQPLVTCIQDTWGNPFILSSLGGLIFAGKTGFKAAEHHSPVVGGRERYVFYGFPHIAIGSEGELGLCYRCGRDELSTACGALSAFQKELASGQARTWLETEDPEYSLLKQRLTSPHGFKNSPDLLELTQRAYEVIHEDLLHLAATTVNTAHADYAIFTGIQVHGPEQTYVWPGDRMIIVGGNKL